MNLRRFTIENNVYAFVAAFVGIVLINAASPKTHWRVWIHWSWGDILGHFAGIAFVSLFGFGFSYGIAEHLMKNKDGERVERSRPAAYALCVIAVLAFSVAFGEIAAAPVEPGDQIESTHQTATEYRPPLPDSKRDEMIETIFWISLLPALLAVRGNLGPKARAASD